MKTRKHIHRNYLILISGIILVIFLATFKFKVNITNALLTDLRGAREQVAQVADANERLQQLKSETGHQSKHPARQTREAIQQHLLDGLTRLGDLHHVSVVGISGGEENGDGQYAVTSFDVAIHGNYSNLVRVISAFEHENQLVRLASVRFVSKLNRQTKKKELNAHLHIQQLVHA